MTVDAYFNVTGTYNGTTYDTNLFFSDSPFKVVRTGYLYLTKSADGGKTWSAPTLIPNVKTTSEQVCLVGPGRGLVTYVNNVKTIVFPVYKYNGSSDSQQMGFIYSSDGGATWTRSANFTGDSWSSESAVVELEDGTLRFFYRNGNSKLYYADYTWGTGWGSAVNTGIATNSNTQISAISLQNTVDGKQVILVSCPTGSNNAGSADSSGSARLNGRIQIGLVDSENYTMTWKTPIDVTTNDSQFMYSCLTALTDEEGNETGKVAILYENKENAWGTGSNCYYTMDFQTYDLASYLTFDEEVAENIYYDGVEGNNTAVEINFGTESYESVEVTQANPEVLSGKDYVAYDIEVTGFGGTSATVTIPLNGTFADSATLHAVYIDDAGVIAETIQGDYNTEADTFTFAAKHFSTYAVLAEDDAEIPEYSKTEEVTLTVGEYKDFTDDTGDYESSYTGAGLNTAIATVTVKGATTAGTPAVPESTVKVTSLSAGTYIIGNGTQWLTLNGTTLGYTTDASQATQWTIAASGNSWTIKSGDNYLRHRNNGLSASTSTSNITWSYSGSTGFYYTSSGRTYYLRWSGSAWQVSTTNSNNGAAYTYTPGQAAVEGDAITTITFTGVSAGTTSVVVGETLYNITVNRKEQTVSLTVGGTATYTDASTSAPVIADSTVASATLTNGTLTIQGLKEGTTTITTGTTKYTVTVANRGGAQDAFTIAVSEDKTVSVALNDGEYVEWSVADASIAGVAGILNTEDNTYGANGMVVGRAEGTTTVTGTVKNAAGEVVAVYTWKVTVTAKTTSGSGTRTVYVNVDLIENCTVYYSINGGELIEVNGTGIVVDKTINAPDLFNIMLFAAPDEGYALTYIGYLSKTSVAVGDSNQYYTLSNGNPDGTGSDAWPFVEANYSGDVPTSGGDSAWKSSHGFRWALIEGNMSINQMKVLFSNAIALGCDGVTTITVNNTNNGTYNYSNFYFVAQKLPTITKEISTINGEPYTDDMAVELGDTISYTIKVTKHKAYGNVTKSYPAPANNSNTVTESAGTITFTDDKLIDELTGSSFSPTYTALGTTGSSDVTYTYTTTLKLTTANFADVVKDGTITNTADLSYDYSAGYSTGSLSSSASAEAKKVTVKLHTYVIDFGLPVNIDLSNVLGDDRIESGTADFGEVTVDAEKTSFTYTPTKVLTGSDYVSLTLSDDYRYGVYIVPASNVLYEAEDFMTTASNGFTAEWKKETGARTTTQSADNKAPYGYDDAYKTDAGNSMGSAWTVADMASGQSSESLVTAFYGNGFDLIGTAGPNTGYVYLRLKNNDGGRSKAVVIDTSYNDGGVTLYQVPLAHVELENANYTATVFCSYRAVEGGTGATAYSARSTGFTMDEGLFTILDMIDQDGFCTDEIEFVYFDKGSPLAALNSAVSTYALTLYDADDESEADSIVTRQAGTTVTIDGFRVYRAADNAAYVDGEKNITYVNVLDKVQDGFAAYVEGNAGGTWTASNYEANGGPQNEIYLNPEQSSGVVLQLDSVPASGKVQISARAVSGTANLNGSQEITSNTEMYYWVDVADDGTVTITNTGTGMLAIGNLKVPSSTEAINLLGLDDEAFENVMSTASRMMVSYAAASVEPEPDPVFEPAQLDVKVKSTNVIRNKLVTVTITASTDVAKLTINGKEVWPTNSLLVKWGWSKTYMYVFIDTVKKSESKDYEIIAYDANGVASEAITVTG